MEWSAELYYRVNWLFETNFRTALTLGALVSCETGAIMIISLVKAITQKDYFRDPL